MAAEYTDCISVGGLDPYLNEHPDIYDTKKPDGETPVILELWEMQSTPLLPSLTSPPLPDSYYLIGCYLWVK